MFEIKHTPVHKVQ